jgi:hypothetical protein
MDYKFVWSLVFWPVKSFGNQLLLIHCTTNLFDLQILFILDYEPVWSTTFINSLYYKFVDFLGYNFI